MVKDLCNQSSTGEQQNQFWSNYRKNTRANLKKNLVVVFCVVCLLPIVMYIFSGLDPEYVSDASVCQQNGDIAIVVRTDELHIIVFDRDGNEKQRIRVDSSGGGYAHVDYIGTELYLYVLREQSVYKVTTEGELVTPDSVPEGVCKDSWNENWENTYWTHIAKTEFGEVTYRKRSVFAIAFAHVTQRFTLRLPDGTEKILWESPIKYSQKSDQTGAGGT